MAQLTDDEKNMVDLMTLSIGSGLENDTAREEKIKLQFQRFHQLQQTRRELSEQGVEGLNDEVLVPVLESRSRLSNSTNKLSEIESLPSSTSAPLTPRALKRYFNAANSKPHSQNNNSISNNGVQQQNSTSSRRLVVRRKKQHRRARNSTLELTSDEDTNMFDNNRDGVYTNSEERQALHQQTTPFMRSSFEALYDPRFKRIKSTNHSVSKNSSSDDDESVRGEAQEELQRSLEMGLPKERFIGVKKVRSPGSDVVDFEQKLRKRPDNNKSFVELEPGISEIQTLYDEKGNEIGSAKQLQFMKLNKSRAKNILLFTALGEPAGILHAFIANETETSNTEETDIELINEIAVLLENQNQTPVARVPNNVNHVEEKWNRLRVATPQEIKGSQREQIKTAIFNKNIQPDDSVFDYDGRFIGTAYLLHQNVGTEKMDFHEELFDSFGESIGMIHASECFTANKLENPLQQNQVSINDKGVFTFDVGMLQCNSDKRQSTSSTNTSLLTTNKIPTTKAVSATSPRLLERSILSLALDGENYLIENGSQMGSLRRIIATQVCNENTLIFNRNGQLVGSINNLLNKARLSYFMKIYDEEKKFLGLLNELVRKNYFLKKSDSKQRVYDSFGNQVGFISDLQYGNDIPTHSSFKSPISYANAPAKEPNLTAGKPLSLPSKEKSKPTWSSVTNRSEEIQPKSNLGLSFAQPTTKSSSEQKPHSSYVYNLRFQKDKQVLNNKSSYNQVTTSSPPAIPQRHIGPMVKNPNRRRIDLQSEIMFNGQMPSPSSPQIPKRSISMRNSEQYPANSHVDLISQDSHRHKPQRATSLMIKQRYTGPTIAPAKSIAQKDNGVVTMNLAHSSTQVNPPATGQSQSQPNQLSNDKYSRQRDSRIANASPVISNPVLHQEKSSSPSQRLPHEHINSLIHRIQKQFSTKKNNVTPKLVKEGVNVDHQFQIERRETNYSNHHPLRQRPASTQFDEGRRSFSPTTKHFQKQPIEDADSPYMYLPRARSQLATHAADGFNRSLSPAAQRYEQRIVQQQQHSRSPNPSISQQMLSAAARLNFHSQPPHVDVNQSSLGKASPMLTSSTERNTAPLRYSTPEVSPERSTLGGPDWVSTSSFSVHLENDRSPSPYFESTNPTIYQTCFEEDFSSAVNSNENGAMTLDYYDRLNVPLQNDLFDSRRSQSGGSGSGGQEVGENGGPFAASSRGSSVIRNKIASVKILPHNQHSESQLNQMKPSLVSHVTCPMSVTQNHALQQCPNVNCQPLYPTTYTENGVNPNRKTFSSPLQMLSNCRQQFDVNLAEFLHLCDSLEWNQTNSNLRPWTNHYTKSRSPSYSPYHETQSINPACHSFDTHSRSHCISPLEERSLLVSIDKRENNGCENYPSWAAWRSADSSANLSQISSRFSSSKDTLEQEDVKFDHRFEAAPHLHQQFYAQNLNSGVKSNAKQFFPAIIPQWNKRYTSSNSIQLKSSSHFPFMRINARLPPIPQVSLREANKDSKRSAHDKIQIVPNRKFSLRKTASYDDICIETETPFSFCLRANSHDICVENITSQEDMLDALDGTNKMPSGIPVRLRVEFGSDSCLTGRKKKCYRSSFYISI